MQYYFEKSGSRHYVVRVTRHGCNSEIVAIFETKRQAVSYINKRNMADVR